MSYTAHAFSNGMVILSENNGKKLATIFCYNGKPRTLPYTSFVADILADKEENEELSSEREILENGNYPGRTTNFHELASANINYAIISDESKDADPLSESLDFDESGELRRIRIEEGKEAPEVYEPLTVSESLWIISKILGEEYVEGVTLESAHRSIAGFIIPLLELCNDKLNLCREKISEYNDSLLRYKKNGDSWESSSETLIPAFLPLHHLSPESCKTADDKAIFWKKVAMRVAKTVEDGNPGGAHSYCNIYNIGERKGITDITKELAVQDRTPQQQYTDCDFPDLLKEAYENNQLFRVFDRDGKIALSSETTLFYLRQSEEREIRFERLEAFIKKASLETLEKHLLGNDSVIYKKYRESVSRCAPGPKSIRKNGKWDAAPLHGKEATEVLLTKGFSQEKLSPKVRYHRGSSWENLWLNKKQITALSELAQKRADFLRSLKNKNISDLIPENKKAEVSVVPVPAKEETFYFTKKI